MSVSPPPVLFKGRLSSSAEMSRRAEACWEQLGDGFRDSPELTAMIMANHPEAVALFFALSACRGPVVLLSPDPRSWRTSPPLPGSTRLVLTPSVARLQAHASRLGLPVTTLPEPEPSRSRGEVRFLTCPGFVFFTSGSTGLPRPVYRRTDSLLRASTALTKAVGFSRDGGVIATLPLDRAYGMNNSLVAATVLGRPLGLLERFEHNELLALFATGTYEYWAGSPVMVDILNRCRAPEPHRAPPYCIFAGRLSAPLSRAFQARFGVPLRQLYGTTETLTVSVDLAPSHEVQSLRAGRPLSGVSVCIGEDPHAPSRVGDAGRIWVRSPWLMEGYGFPPHVEREGCVDGWWATPDIGRLESDGTLTIVGRADDRIRTGAGHIIDPAQIVERLEGHVGVRDVAVVPLETPTGPVLGVLVETSEPLRVIDLRDVLVRSIPPWAQPRVIDTTPELPRLASGRTDRRACIEILDKALHREPTS